MLLFIVLIDSIKVLFEEKEVKYLSYAAGEELFGLPKTEQTVLVKLKGDLDLLDSLYLRIIEIGIPIFEKKKVLTLYRRNSVNRRIQPNTMVYCESSP